MCDHNGDMIIMEIYRIYDKHNIHNFNIYTHNSCCSFAFSASIYCITLCDDIFEIYRLREFLKNLIFFNYESFTRSNS